MADLTIKNWELGIGESPYTGFAQMTNVDIYSQPGSLKISQRLITSGNSAPTGLVIWWAQDPSTQDTYGVDRAGKLYKVDGGTSNWSVITGHGTTDANGQGLAIWKNYLFYIRQNRIDVYGPLSAGPTWTNDWQAVTPFATPYDLLDPFPDSYHPAFTMTNGTMAIGNANFVDTLEQTANTIFDPTDNTTWLYNDKDLELDFYYRVHCLEQISSDLAVGTTVGGSLTNIADTFFWDRFSNYFDSNKTIRFAENGVQIMKNLNNTLFTIAGLGLPRLFKSFTAQAAEFKRFNNINLIPGESVRLFPAATDQKDGELLLGIGHEGTATTAPMGVYSTRGSSYVLRYLISTGNDGSTGIIRIGAIITYSPERFLVSWQDTDTNTFGIDVLDNNYYTGYTAYVESPIYTVGTEDDPTTYETIKVTLGKQLNTGDGIIIKARKSLDDTFVTIATFDTPTYVGRYSLTQKVKNISQFVDAQFRIELTTGVNSIVSPEIKEITFT